MSYKKFIDMTDFEQYLIVADITATLFKWEAECFIFMSRDD